MSQEDYASDEEMGYEEEEDEGDCYMDDSDGGGSDEDDYAGGEMLGTKKARTRRSGDMKLTCN